MQQNQKAAVDWRSREFLSIAETASILARSPAWVRGEIIGERLDGRRITKSSPTVVTVASVLRMIARAERAKPSSQTPERTRLFCIINNDK